MTTQATVTLYRPVGPEELELIRQSGCTAFPPRLPEQPIFYPVLTMAYAVKIARDWNVPASGAGYVTRFAVSSSFLSSSEVQAAGGVAHQEYRIPADALPAFNAASRYCLRKLIRVHRTRLQTRQAEFAKSGATHALLHLDPWRSMPLSAAACELQFRDIEAEFGLSGTRQTFSVSQVCCKLLKLFGVPYGIRTRVTNVKG